MLRILRPFCSFSSRLARSPAQWARTMSSKPSSVESHERPLRPFVDGRASVLMFEKTHAKYSRDQEGVANRDLSVQVKSLFVETIKAERRKHMEEFPTDCAHYAKLNSFVDRMRMLDCNTSTGLRSIRTLQEVNGVTEVVVNVPHDYDVPVVERNLAANGPYTANVKQISVNPRTALYSAIEFENQYDIIDLDVSNNIEAYFDGIVQAVAGDGGLICLSHYDNSAQAGHMHPLIVARYGSATVSTPYVAELSLRALLHAVETSANRYKRYIFPWLSVYQGTHTRFYFRVYESVNMMSFSMLKRMWVIQSTVSSAFHTKLIGTQLPRREGLVKKPPPPSRYVKAAAVAANSTQSSLENADFSDGHNGSDGDGAAHEQQRDESESEEDRRSEIFVPIPRKFLQKHEVAAEVLGVHYKPAQWTLPARDEETGGRWRMVGPVWADRLHDEEVAFKLYTRYRQRLAAALRRSPVSSIGGRGGGRGSGGGNSRGARSPGGRVDGPAYIPAGGTVSGADNAAADADAHRKRIEVLTYLSRVLFDITEEVLDAPLYYSVRTLCSEAQSLRTPTHAELRSALINAGYQASGFHGAEGMLKTNAPDGVIWDLMRYYLTRSDNQHASHVRLRPTAVKLREKAAQYEWNFELHKSVRYTTRVRGELTADRSKPPKGKR